MVFIGMHLQQVLMHFLAAGLPSKPVIKQKPKTLWKDPLFLASLGVALLALGLQGYRVGLLSKLTAR